MAMTIALFILSIAFLAPCTSADEHASNFGYYGANGPEKWGSISPSYSACSNGKAQSPVDLRKENIVLNKQLQSLDRHYYSTNATLVNNGFNVGVHFDGKVGDVSIDGTKYSLKHMHWHVPSEHWLDGRQFDAELHLVHQTEDGRLTVVGVLYKLGDSDPLIAMMEDKLVQLAKESSAGNKEAPIALGAFDLKHVKGKTRTYYRYPGSLTTPPCKEQVTWNILGKVRSFSMKQLELLKAPLSPEFKNNARPVQPLNGRNIEKYSQ